VLGLSEAHPSRQRQGISRRNAASGVRAVWHYAGVPSGRVAAHGRPHRTAARHAVARAPRAAWSHVFQPPAARELRFRSAGRHDAGSARALADRMQCGRPSADRRTRRSRATVSKLDAADYSATTNRARFAQLELTGKRRGGNERDGRSCRDEGKTDVVNIANSEQRAAAAVDAQSPAGRSRFCRAPHRRAPRCEPRRPASRPAGSGIRAARRRTGN
jgi:hypothetical protein